MWEGLATSLEGSLIVLEPLQRSHEAALLRDADDPEVWRWLPDAMAQSPARFGRWMSDALAASEAGEEAAFAIVDRATRNPVGSTRYLALRPEHRGLEIGWTWLKRSAWRTGINVEAKLLLLTHAFEQLGCIRVEFKTDARNIRSRTAIEALGASFEGTFRNHHLLRDGSRRDSAYYSITDGEWPDVRATLQKRLRAGS